MALSSETARNNYTGDGTTNVYAYSFRIFAQTDLLVMVQNIATGAETTLTITTDYTVDSVGESDGDITLVNASQAWLDSSGYLTSDYKMSIIRDPALVQNTDIRNQGTFYPEIHEDAFDKQMMVSQRQEDKIDRSVKLPETIPSSTFDPALPTNIADNPGAALMVNASGDGFTLSTQAFSFYIQNARPTTNPASNELAFWFSASIDQMHIWCVNEWRIIA